MAPWRDLQSPESPEAEEGGQEERERPQPEAHPMLPGGDQRFVRLAVELAAGERGHERKAKEGDPGGILVLADARHWIPDRYGSRRARPLGELTEPEIEHQKGMSPDVVAHAVRADGRLVAVGLNPGDDDQGRQQEEKQGDAEGRHRASALRPARRACASPPGRQRHGASHRVGGMVGAAPTQSCLAIWPHPSPPAPAL